VDAHSLGFVERPVGRAFMPFGPAVVAAVIVAALAAIGGSEFDVFQRLNLPRIAIGGDTLTAGGAITGAVAIIVTLLFAVIGGKVGERFHKRVDRVATDEFVVER